MNGRLADRVAVITGAASGIGRVAALTMAAEGANVLAADLREDGARQTAELVRAAGGRCDPIVADIADETQVKAMVDAARDRFGRLDVLYNNAAFTDASMHAKDMTVVDLDAEVWDLSMTVNARGAMLACKHAIPLMIEGGGGSIVNTASNQALSGDLSQTAYAAAKGAIVTLTRSVATAFGAQGIRCNCISPGAIRTPSLLGACPPDILEVIAANNLVPRLGEPEDIANLAVFLASDESAFITGEVIRCDGGQLSHLPHYSYLMAASATTTRSA